MILCGVPAAPALAEPFIGQFELKTLESAPGDLEFQSQNAWSWGQPPRRIHNDHAAGFVLDENSIVRERYALELEIGVTRFVKTRLGVEFEQERLDDPAMIAHANDFDDLKLAEVGAEIIAILAPRDADGAGLGVVAEIEGPVDQEESNHLTLGAIIEYRSGQWFAAGAPMVVRSFGGEADAGERTDDKWDLAYAAQLGYDLSPSWSLAFEAYGTVERLGDTGRPSDSAELFGDFDQHRAGAVLYYTYAFNGAYSARRQLQESALAAEGPVEEGTALTVGLGLLEGLNDHTPDHTLKLSVELQF